MLLSEYQAKIATDPVEKAKFESDPAAAISAAVASNPLMTDTHIYRIVVIALGLCLVFGMLGALVLSYFGKNVPAEATALGSAAVGALAGLLAPSPRQG